MRAREHDSSGRDEFDRGDDPALTRVSHLHAHLQSRQTVIEGGDGNHPDRAHVAFVHTSAGSAPAGGQVEEIVVSVDGTAEEADAPAGGVTYDSARQAETERPRRTARARQWRLQNIPGVRERSGGLFWDWDRGWRAHSPGRARRPRARSVRTRRVTSRNTIPLIVKRAVDLAAGGTLLVALAPLMALVAAAIKRDSPGPVFYNRVRVGKDGRHFVMYKFRTMSHDAEMRLAGLQHLNAGGPYMIKISNDPRVTRVGKLLRGTSIDELPQLINVLKGEMSLVGPRPQTPGEVALYTGAQRRRLAVKPGITGLWQIRDRHNPSFEQWIAWDLAYVERWSLWLDTRIACETAALIAKDSWASFFHVLRARVHPGRVLVAWGREQLARAARGPMEWSRTRTGGSAVARACNATPGRFGARWR